MIQEGAVGVEINYQVLDVDGGPLDISTATNLLFTVRKPDGTSYTAVPAFDTDGADGVLNYVTTEPAQLTPAGTFKVQPSFTMGLFTGRSATALFTVYRNV